MRSYTYAALDSLQEARDQKIEGVLLWIKNLASDAEELKKEKMALPCFIDLAYQGKPVTTDVSRTILARYYKGCSNIHENSGIAIPILTPDRAEKRQNGRRFKEDGEPMFTLTGQDRHGVGIEPLGVLRNVRSDYGKEIRKDYEAGNIKISRHEFLESEVRDDGVVNTLSTVQKDNQLAVKVAEATKQGYSECRVGVDSVNLSVPGAKPEEEE